MFHRAHLVTNIYQQSESLSSCSEPIGFVLRYIFKLSAIEECCNLPSIATLGNHHAR